MDIFAHAMYGGVLYKGIKEKEISKRAFGWAFFWGAFPDLFAFTIPFFINVLNGGFGHHVIGNYDLAARLYDYSHSLVIFAVVFFIVWRLKKTWKVPLLGWGLHILFDIPTHSIDFFPTPFLFPLSEYRFPYGIQWSTPWIWIGSWVVIGILYTILTVRAKRRNKLIQ